MKTAYIALGSNMGDRLEYLKQALAMLSAEKKISLQAVSAVYETAPVGGPEQGSYLNACSALVTDFTPVLLLHKLLETEELMGRVREERWGPRVIDLDLLIYNKVMMNTPFLELPHPRLVSRDFVLVPLADIAPDLLITGQGVTVREILEARKPASDVKLFLAPSWHIGKTGN